MTNASTARFGNDSVILKTPEDDAFLVDDDRILRKRVCPDIRDLARLVGTFLQDRNPDLGRKVIPLGLDTPVLVDSFPVVNCVVDLPIPREVSVIRNVEEVVTVLAPSYRSREGLRRAITFLNPVLISVDRKGSCFGRNLPVEDGRAVRFDADPITVA